MPTKDKTRNMADHDFCEHSQVKQIPDADITADDIWGQIRDRAVTIIRNEEVMENFITTMVLDFSSLSEMIINRISCLLGEIDLPTIKLRNIFSTKAINADIERSFVLDLIAIYDRDPVCLSFLDAALYFKGFHAITAHRLNNSLWQAGHYDLAFYLQSCISRKLQVDIHPNVPIGNGIMVDHATGLVVGETAIIDNNVSILHGVTLGGTGKKQGDRHPKIRSGVLIGAGAKLLGNFEVGECSIIGAGSVVLNPVPPRSTVAGVPGKIVGKVKCDLPACDMQHLNQKFTTSDKNY